MLIRPYTPKPAPLYSSPPGSPTQPSFLAPPKAAGPEENMAALLHYEPPREEEAERVVFCAREYVEPMDWWNEFHGMSDGSGWQEFGIPRWPDDEELPSFFLPRAPKLKPEMSAAERVRWLARYYWRACEWATGERADPLGKKKGCPIYAVGTLTHAAERLIHWNLAPAAWAAFRLATWGRHENKKSTRALFPSITQVWAPSLIDSERFRAWFRDGDYLRLRKVQAPLYAQITAGWFALRAELSARRLRIDDPNVRAICKEAMDRHLPNYPALREEAILQARALRGAITAQTENGGWPWP